MNLLWACPNLGHSPCTRGFCLLPEIPSGSFLFLLAPCRAFSSSCSFHRVLSSDCLQALPYLALSISIPGASESPGSQLFILFANEPLSLPVAAYIYSLQVLHWLFIYTRSSCFGAFSPLSVTGVSGSLLQSDSSSPIRHGST